MSVATYSATVGAGATVRNCLENTILESAPDSGYLDVYACHNAAAGQVEMQITVGDQIVGEDLQIPDRAGAPNKDSDAIATRIPVKKGMTLKLSLFETSAVATATRVRAELTPRTESAMLRDQGYTEGQIAQAFAMGLVSN
jgi:hypothetical protein